MKASGWDICLMNITVTVKGLQWHLQTYLSEKTENCGLGHLCLVAGLGNSDMREGTFDYYMREPVENDAKGIAPLILAYIETMFRSR